MSKLSQSQPDVLPKEKIKHQHTWIGCIVDNRNDGDQAERAHNKLDYSHDHPLESLRGFIIWMANLYTTRHCTLLDALSYPSRERQSNDLLAEETDTQTQGMCQMESTDQTSKSIFSRRYSVRQLMQQTAIASLFFAALLHENQWWRATLGTVTIAMIFNELLAIIYASGTRRAFAIGHSMAAFLLPFSLYAAGFTLPYLITLELLKWIKSIQPIDETNFYVVMGIFWVQVACRASGTLGMYWYRHSQDLTTVAQRNTE